jgi:hypothetical protein
VGLHPNPCDGTFIITLPSAVTRAHVTIFDACGRIVLERQIATNEPITVNTTAGLYFVKIITPTSTSTEKLFIR